MAQPESSLVSVDVVPLTYDRHVPGVLLGVHRREHKPFTGRRALPGVLLGRGERLHQAGLRALAKLGTAPGRVTGMGQLITFDEPNRDPRGPTLSIACWATVDDAGQGPGEWFPLREHPPLAFDHDRIVDDVLPLLAALLWRDVGFSRGLTGPRFTAGEAVDLTTSLTGTAPDRGNLNRTLAGITALERTQERRSVKGTGRPSVVWAWTG